MTPFRFSSPGSFPHAGPPPDLVVYLHGFRSSSRSVKAQKVIDVFHRAGLGGQLWVPDLPASPEEAMHMVQSQLDDRLASQPDLSLAFVGSSLGGYYATVLGEQHPQSKVVLLNPAIEPYLDLHDQLGKKTVYFTEEEFEFLPAYLDALKAMQVTTLTRSERYFLVAAAGDEVLNCDTMLARYPAAHCLHLLGSDHALSDFDDILPFVRLFLGVV